MKKHTQRGFTLIELLVVIAIIGILSSVVLASLNSAKLKARDAKRVSEVKQVQTALELYLNSCGVYPATLTLAASTGCPSGTTLGSFIPVIPTAPDPGAYTYDQQSSGTSYCLGTLLESPDSPQTQCTGTNVTTVVANYRVKP